jgi:glyceraldehyde 3-phosphate dehydrogenase
MKIAINGFGRIGRATCKIALDKKGVQIVAINDLTDTRTLAYLFKYDTVYGRYNKKVSYDEKNLIINGRKIPVFAEKDPSNLPWKKLGVDTVLECTGVFDKKEELKAHLKAGAKKVILSAPAKDEILTLVFGTEKTKNDLGKEKIISNASCTTNCIAPVMQVLESVFGVEKSIMTTIHAYTATQKIIDGPDSKDLRRGRAGAANMAPSSTGAAKATTLVIPELKDKFDGIAVRVPVICGSLSDITVVLKKAVTAEQVNIAFVRAAKKPLFKGILRVTEKDEELCSSDVIGTNDSCIIDTKYTRVVGGNLVKVLAWYDNEWGYSCRLIEMALAN